jgi:asparagine synthase (glutamine-hydrolysing)
VSARLALTASGWLQHGQTHARGQAFDAAGALLRAGALAARFDGLATESAWAAAAADLNGCFAIVTSADAKVHACVDRLRTIPLFYASTPHGLMVADHADAIYAQLPQSRLDALAASEFRCTGYVTGEQTLIAGLRQIPAGHRMASDASSTVPTLHRYYEFRHGDFVDPDGETIIAQLRGTHEQVFRRLVTDIGDRSIVVPLSGGYDSRLIGVALRDLGCKNVLCYSYGAEGNWEANISRELAAYLGFEWTMVPYSAERWRAWAKTPEFRAYFRAAGNLCAVPHIQDWPAVYELKRRGALADDAVFVPGHSGDFLAGSHVPKWYPARTQLTRDEILQSLFDAHFTLWDWPADPDNAMREAMAARIEAIAGRIETSTPEVAADIYERWDCQERQAKFIVNSVRVYESLGYEWRLPLFDSALMDFWSRIPIEGRVGRAMYFRFVAQHQQLPITPANTDHAAPVAKILQWVNASGMRPLAKRAQRALHRAQWRSRYDGGDMRWFALVDRDEFRRRYSGREIGHSFFALQYLKDIGG